MTTKQYSYESRHLIKPIARKVIEITIADGQTVGQTTSVINGEVVAFEYDIPDLTGTGTTVTFDFLDEDAVTWHQKASIAENAITLEKLSPSSVPLRFAFAGTATFKCTASASQTGAKVLNVICFYR